MWKKNNKGRGSGIMLIVIIAVAVVIALLAAQQFASLNPPEKKGQPENYVDAAKEAVDSINERIKQATTTE